MKNQLSFDIEVLNEEQLRKELALYPQLRAKLKKTCYSEENETKLLCAEIQSKIALLYRLYCEDRLDAGQFGEYTKKNGPAFFGAQSSPQLMRTQSTVCRVLADLDVKKIGGRRELADRYHQLRLMVDHAKAAGKSFICELDFWLTYFEFHDLYCGK